MIPAVLRLLSLSLLMLIVFSCAAPPAPVEPPRTPPPPPPVAPVERVLGTVRVTASALNVRREPNTDGEVITQVKKGTTLEVLSEDDSWTRVKLGSGEVGWVASRFVTSGKESKAAPAKRKSGCPADSDYAFIDTPMLAFSDSGAHGLVIVEANVNTKGTVTSTKVVSNSTGDEALAFLAEKEIKGAKFSPPIRDCVARSFIFTYRRTF